MKLRLRFRAVAISGLISVLAVAQGELAIAAIDPVPATVTEPGSAIGNVLKASDLIGMDVIREDRQKVGKVEDVVVGLDDGRIVVALVSINKNSTLRAVPPRILHYDLLQQVVRLKCDPVKLAKSPEIQRPTWKEAMASETELRQRHR